MFPSAPCVVSRIDLLIHHAEIIAIEGESYRLKWAAYDLRLIEVYREQYQSPPAGNEPFVDDDLF